jgi:hypothetical protein
MYHFAGEEICKYIYVYDEDFGGYFHYKHYRTSKENHTLGWAFLIGGLAIHLTNIIHASIDAVEYNERLMQELIPESRGEFPFTLTMHYRADQQDFLLNLNIRF